MSDFERADVRYASFFVAGKPVTQGSKTARKMKDGRAFVVEVNERELKPWRARIATAAQEVLDAGDWAYVDKGPVALTLRFFLDAPQALPRWRKVPWGMPDLSKMTRAVEDSLAKVWFRDDGQVDCLIVSKVYALNGPPGVWVRIDRLGHFVERNPREEVEHRPPTLAERVVVQTIGQEAARRPPEAHEAPDVAPQAVLPGIAAPGSSRPVQAVVCDFDARPHRLDDDDRPCANPRPVVNSD